MNDSRIVVTGATGFIGSNLLYELEKRGYDKIVGIDWFGNNDKWRNVAKRSHVEFVSPDIMWRFLNENQTKIDAIIHLGGISSTTENNVDLIMSFNYRLTLDLFNFCQCNKIRFIYASSAATYGNGYKGFNDSDDTDSLKEFMPLNVYGWSKKQVDLYISAHRGFRNNTSQVIGLKFFNVYGPNEYHKGRQQSVVRTFYEQARDSRVMRLFASNCPGIGNGEQLRDFVYVDDCIDVIIWFLNHPELSGIYNVGTGNKTSFNEVARNVAMYINEECDIEYIDMPESIRNQYQNNTCANITKLRECGYTHEMQSISVGIKDYIQNYLMQPDKYR